MTYDFNGKKIKIPDSEINKYVEKLKMSKEEAVQLWLEDEGYLDNEEQQELEKKAKENRITATIHDAQSKEVTNRKSAQKTQKERVCKENPTKEMVIAEIAQLLPKFAENVEIVNKGKLITFTIGDNNFKLDLIQTRKPKTSGSGNL
jgi:hypothetical protein